MKLIDLETFFENVKVWPEKITIDECSIIANPKQMVSSHIKMLKANSGNKLFQPYYDRLILVMNNIK